MNDEEQIKFLIEENKKLNIRLKYVEENYFQHIFIYHSH